jgi:hypothetical protein
VTESLPANLKENLPTIEEQELKGGQGRFSKRVTASSTIHKPHKTIPDPHIRALRIVARGADRDNDHHAPAFQPQSNGPADNGTRAGYCSTCRAATTHRITKIRGAGREWQHTGLHYIDLFASRALQ